ncbi:2,5-diamino-6-(ribosylamino)-4(3H)-pyrimidinone 5'-phosphate reductase [Coccidioides posadasii str. Silveira]|uniref:2,5-diamino-6-ribosylamino-4(3H)-pyrimidinone 5'-phosphate reductase n=3 Tax=Coccidioides posadasii TaxID=199306 RepID=E9DED5_COCPS|nr:RibD C-terminal domain containing protein [Coccidioides posadasii C735 delta SOWgp]EER28307.1 RibD C-terminal domain containing protein [Coccidioides posadasii C735 delta SOWgp]EFW14997.1 riboflavin-specific deaminase [Coccidioides posadasii str. Silveira]KMM68772.1 5-amino-6-(5-phosphoribosylamino)uracil reductase [Coccidioides posadasii RMSCC 3488]QVM09972.1 2,5-diamino-6-(ribosylamino)-4(3H)-pyrimidinone 5'-phosphate reductase [Coccidioides posadasii str. Silveira]|eukprot:XP_003070452.1 RibD C-terminal domain containing protein [Coccidioides posadasii C735 delta SOWgp]
MEAATSTEKEPETGPPTADGDVEMGNGTAAAGDTSEDEDSKLQSDIQAQLAAETRDSAAAQPSNSTSEEISQTGLVVSEATDSDSAKSYEVPPNIARIRQEMFELRQPIELSLEEYNLYWPFIDNVWVKQRSSTTRDKTATSDYYCCRQRKQPTRRNEEKAQGQPYPEGKRRHRAVREGPVCGFQIKVVKTEGTFASVTISRQTNCSANHSHDLDHMDKVKRNSGLLSFIKQEAEKAYIPASILAKFREDPDALAAIGGRFLSGVDVRNVCAKWRAANPNAELKTHQGYLFQNGIGVYKVGSRPACPGAAQITPQPKITLTSHAPDALAFPSFSLEFLQPYLPTREENRKFPHVTLTYAQSMDGKISLAPGVQTVLSGPESKLMTHYLRSRHDAILIGVGTALADNPGLNCRLEGAGGYGGLGKMWQPRPVIVDPTGRWPINPECRILKTALAGKGKAPWVVVSPCANISADRILLLKKHGGDFLRISEFNPSWRLQWSTIFGALAAEGINSIMVEGGGVVLSELLNPEYEDFVDSVIVTVAPTYLGRGGVGVAPDSKRDEYGKPKVSLKPKEPKWHALGQDVIMCSKVRVPPPPPILPGIEDAALGLSGE